MSLESQAGFGKRASHRDYRKQVSAGWVLSRAPSRGHQCGTFATALQDSQVQKLTQPWSTVMSTVQGLSNGYLDRAESGSVGLRRGCHGGEDTGLGGAVTSTTRKVTDASTKLQGDFNNTVSTMQTYTHSPPPLPRSPATAAR